MTHRAMVARLARRFIRASLFIWQTVDDFAGEFFEISELFLAEMVGF